MPDKKLTDNEIIKALECCCDKDKCNQCPMAVDCWFFCDKGYVDAPPVLRQALDLINRQQAEIERLKKGWKADIILTENAKAEAYKEFVERLKENDYYDGEDFYIKRKDIDTLLKELVGEDQ